MSTIDYYDENAEQFFQETVGIDMNSLYESFLSLLPKRATILDAGCGSGRDSLYFKKEGYQITAFDGSLELTRLASKALKHPVLHLTFQQIEFEKEFDGVWACASLLHIPRNEMSDVLSRLSNSLKQEGIFYASFKYGNKEYEQSRRYFNCYDAESFSIELKNQPNLKIIKTWVTDDLRKGRNQEKWLNVLLKKL